MAGHGGKLFLGGISLRTTEEMILDHFMAYGAIIDVVAMRQPDGRPRGFGFVTFEDPAAAEAALAEAQIIDGRQIDMKVAVPQGSEGAPGAPFKPPLPLGPPPLPLPFAHPVNGLADELADAVPDRTAGGAKLFLGGISPYTTTEALSEYFGQFGNLLDVVAMRDKEGRSRGFGFVTYEDPGVADVVLLTEHLLDGNAVDVKLAVRPEALAAQQEPPPPLPPQEPPRGPRGPRGPRTDKVFVGGLGQATHEDLVQYFEKYGNLIDAVVMKREGKPRGFGFVRYDNADSVEEVMRDYEIHQINGKWIEVKRAVPEEGGKGAAAAPYSNGGAYVRHPAIGARPGGPGPDLGRWPMAHPLGKGYAPSSHQPPGKGGKGRYSPYY